MKAHRLWICILHKLCIRIFCFSYYFLCPLDFDRKKFRSLKLKGQNYCIFNQTLFWKNPGGVLLRCIDEDEVVMVPKNLHSGSCEGHHDWKTTTFKISRVWYYWPYLIVNGFSKVRAYIECQKIVGRHKLFPLPLKQIVVDAPFQ